MSQAIKGTIFTIDQYECMFKVIRDKHIEYCEEWHRAREEKINLKKKCICDIYNIDGTINDEFKYYLESFRENLSKLYSEVIVELNESLSGCANIKFTFRVKTQESIINKVYNKNSNNSGKFPIINCLNDTLGFRIIDDNYKENIEKIINILNNDEYNIRHMERDINGYKAYHVYFKYGNFNFPIELQIWDKENENNNIQLHTEYKQDYVKNIIKDYNEL